METLIAEIIVLIIIGVVGFFAWQIFGKGKAKLKSKKKVSQVRNKVQFWDESETMICSSWNVSVLSPETGAALKTVPIDLSSEEYFTIGRERDCSLRLNDKTVSSYHAYIMRNSNGDYILRDADSKNGIITIENDTEHLHDEIPLHDNLVCFLGNTPVRISRNSSRYRIQNDSEHFSRIYAVPEDASHQKTKNYERHNCDG